MILKEPVPLKFGADEEAKRLKYVEENIRSLQKGLRPLIEDKIKKWRRLKNGQPETEKKSFPWRGASNLVIQVIATNIDTLLAQMLASVYEIMPIWPAELIGDWDSELHGEEQRAVTEKFLNLMALEKEELDLYRVESVLFESAIGFGLAVAKSPWVNEDDSYCIGESNGTPAYTEVERINGPRPEVVPFEDYWVTPDATTIDSARFQCHRLHLTRWDLEERKFLGRYDRSAVEYILSRGPDKGTVDQVKRDQQEQIGATIPESELEGRWTLYECHYPYWVRVGGQNRRLSIIETFHYESKTSLRAIHNWYPDNQNIFTAARMGYSDRGIYSLGYCEMLEHAQVEVSAEHNRYADNGTLANTSIFRIDPDASSRIDASFSLYPTAAAPFKKDEFEVLNIGRASDTGIDRERQALELVKSRTGVDNGLTAAGGGIVNPKRGIYSAMGTFSALQAGNRRSNKSIADFKSAHIELGRKFLKMYSEFGIGKRLQWFGKDADYLKMALQSVANNRLKIPVRASTGSINKEMEKQNLMLLVNLHRQHYQGITQILQNLGQAPPEVKEYLINVIVASDFMLRRLDRDFGFDDVSRLVPEAQIITQLKEQQANAAKQRQQSGGSNSGGGQGLSGAPVQGERVPQGDMAAQGSGLSGLPSGAEQVPIPVSQ
jgi:hypothetical protein